MDAVCMKLMPNECPYHFNARSTAIIMNLSIKYHNHESFLSNKVTNEVTKVTHEMINHLKIITS